MLGGFDTLVFQWSQHGNAFLEPVEKKWLQSRVQDALDAKLNIVMGLYADPDSFSALDVPSDLLEPYFLKLSELNVQLATEWLTRIPTDRLKGWYIPFEYDDRRWRSVADQTVLNKQLNRDVAALKRLGTQPVYISAFFNGNTTPKQFSKQLVVLKASTGLNIWIQNGQGTGSLLEAERKEYLKTLANCNTTPVAGTIFEIFKQTGSDSQFTAKALPANQLNLALMQRATCTGDSVFFELRYLIDIDR